MFTRHGKSLDAYIHAPSRGQASMAVRVHIEGNHTPEKLESFCRMILGELRAGQNVVIQPDGPDSFGGVWLQD